MHPKPPQILEIEKIVGFELTETKNSEYILNFWNNSKSYLLNEKQEVIGLNVWNCALQSIDFLHQLTNLTHLNFDRNQVSDISVLQHLTNLTRLHFNNNQVADISILQHLQNLTRLSFSYNQVSDISVLQQLVNLDVLNFDNNQVFDISVLQHLPNLTTLYFYNNQVSDISVLQHLTNTRTDISQRNVSSTSSLQYLNFRNNQVSDISVLQHLPKLTDLDFGGNQVSDISVLQHLPNLTSLYFSNNQVSDISALQHLQSLANLWFDNNLISDISILQHLPNLISLSFGNNQVSDISILQHLPNLISLSFGNNQVSDISILKYLINLRLLWFANNNISNISILQYLVNLRQLNFENNQVIDISILHFLLDLEVIALSNNQIKTLPTFFADFRKLRFWGYKGNPFARYMPKNLKLENTQEEIQYILDLQANSRPVREAKVVLVGEGKIGKTTLLGWLLEGKKPETERTDKIEIRDSRENQFYYSPKPSPPAPEGGVNTSKTPPSGVGGLGQSLTVHFWDFGGQDIMHATHKFFMTERTVYVLVTDHRNLKDSEVRKWLKQLETTVGDSPVILVANQCDKVGDKHRLKDKEYRAAFPNLDIREVIETSGETGFGIDKLQNAIQLALQDLEFLSFPIPTPFFKAKEKLLALNKPYISYEKFEEICSEIATQENYNFGEGMQDILAKLLNDLGILLSFKETKNQLDSLQVFQPEWIVNGLYALVVQSNNQIGSNKGILTATQVTEILREKGYTKSTEQNFIKGMLKEFKLAFSHIYCGEEKYFIPSVFDDNRPFDKLEFWDKPAENQKFLRFRYTYENWRADLINYVIVEENVAIKDDIFWKNGVVLEYDYDGKSNQIFVEADNTHEHIDLIICGSADLRLTLEKFRKTLMPSIHGVFTHLGEKPWIIYEENGVKVPIDYKNLLVYLEEKEDKIFIPELRKKLNVKDLLGYVDLPPEPLEVKYARLMKEGKVEEAELLRNEYAHKHDKEMSFDRFGMLGKFDSFEEIENHNFMTKQELLSLIEDNQLDTLFKELNNYHFGSSNQSTYSQLRDRHIDGEKTKSFKQQIAVFIDSFFDTATRKPNAKPEPLPQNEKPTVKENAKPKVERNDIFISYSHHEEEKPYFDEVKRQLATLKAYGLTDVHIWDDTQIRAGDDWLAEIKKGLAKAKVGVLLVSPNFLASKFIGEKEVPALLEAVQNDNGKIMSVIVRKTLFEKHPILGKYQSVNPPSKPLNTLTEAEKDDVYAKLLEDILHLYGR